MDDQITTRPKKKWTHQADNRARLIAAGYAILAEKGLAAATVKEIARRADVSPGLFHYHFESKDELLLAVLYEAGRRFKDQLAEDMRAAAAQGFPAAAVAALHLRGKTDPTWYRLRYELYALGLRKPDFLPEVGEFLAKIRSEMTRTMMEFTGMEESRARATAALLLAGVDGLALQQIAQPDLDLTGAYELMKHLLAGEVHPAQ